jgi:hypothetical protein
MHSTFNSQKPPQVPLPPPTVPPTCYVLVKSRQVCGECGTAHECSDLYASYILPSNWNKSNVKQLRKIAKPEYALPIEVRTKATELVPFCHECVRGISLSHLPPAPSNDTRRLRLDADGDPEAPTALGSGLRAAAERKASKTRMTVDDIFNQLGK